MRYGLCVAVFLTCGLAFAQQYQVLYTFGTNPNDGNGPYGVVVDSSSNVYGNTFSGGSSIDCDGVGCGVVYEISLPGQETILHSFGNSPDGTNPNGTTIYGGIDGYGSVFELSPSQNGWTYTQLHGFVGGTDGVNPDGGLIRDSAGNLYGTTFNGGRWGRGTAFGLSPSGKETIEDFKYVYPYGPLVPGLGGYAYALGEGPGSPNIFKIDAAGTHSVLYTFSDQAGGDGPNDIVTDGAGNVYGTAEFGGVLSCYPPNGCGVVFKVDPKGNETVLYAFTGGTDGALPSGIARDLAGNLYVGANHGGDSNCSEYPPLVNGCGTISKIDTNGNFSVLYTFELGAGGQYPGGPLAVDAAGNLYGTTENSDNACNCGLVFKLSGVGGLKVIPAEE
jgi:uncharacterized repeat protein (TIGR03803 family)